MADGILRVSVILVSELNGMGIVVVAVKTFAFNDDGVGGTPPLIQVFIDNNRSALGVPGAGTASGGLTLDAYPADHMRQH